MKKLSVIILALALVSCSKGYIEEYGGSHEYNTSIAEEYLTIIASKLIPDYLLALESALSYSDYEYYKTAAGQSSYETGGKSLRELGVTWTVSAKRNVSGITITCKGPYTWELYWEGPYSFIYNKKEEDYITKCSLTAIMTDSNGNGHYNWKVIFNGGRTEREGYSCTFKSAPEMDYTFDQNNSAAWDYCNGSATMLVEKNGEKVDLARMDYIGKHTNFFRGL